MSEDNEKTGSGDVTGAPKDEPWPIERQTEVYGKYQALKSKQEQYAALGDVDSVKADMERLAAYDKQVDKYREDQLTTPEEKQTQQSSADIRKQLEELYPALRSLDRLDELDDMRAFREEQVLTQASAHLGSLLKTSGVSVDSDTQGDIEDFLLSKMTATERKAVTGGDFSTIDNVLERTKGSRLLTAILADKSSKTSAPQASRRHRVGGQAAQKKSDKPMTREEALKAGWAMMQESS